MISAVLSQVAGALSKTITTGETAEINTVRLACFMEVARGVEETWTDLPPNSRTDFFSARRVQDGATASCRHRHECTLTARRSRAVAGRAAIRCSVHDAGISYHGPDGEVE